MVGRRLARIVRARRETRAPAPDPMVVLERAQLEQEERLDQARRAVADLVVQRRRVELLAVRASEEMARLNRGAEEAVGRGDDAAARELLRRSIVAGEHRETAARPVRARLDAQVAPARSRPGPGRAAPGGVSSRYLALRADARRRPRRHGGARRARARRGSRRPRPAARRRRPSRRSASSGPARPPTTSWPGPTRTRRPCARRSRSSSTGGPPTPSSPGSRSAARSTRDHRRAARQSGQRGYFACSSGWWIPKMLPSVSR